MQQDEAVYHLADYEVHGVVSETEDRPHARYWHVERFGARRVWEDMRAEGQGVTVAVIDTGVDASHPDLRNVVTSSNDYTGSSSGEDVVGHGTHCCGIVASVAPRARICSFKVFDHASRAVHSNIMRVLSDIEAGKHGRVRIINMSMGSGEPSEAMRMAMLRLAAKGYLIVCAAGNESDHTTPDAPRFGTISWPAHFNSTIAVGSVDQRRKRSKYSSSGPKITVMGPGERVTSCWNNGGYAELSGTSMAAPFVSGCLALLVSYASENDLPPPTASTVLWAMASSSSDMEAAGFDFFTGYGCINPKGMIERYTELCRSG